jgi:hypothetical protein
MGWALPPRPSTPSYNEARSQVNVHSLQDEIVAYKPDFVTLMGLTRTGSWHVMNRSPTELRRASRDRQPMELLRRPAMARYIMAPADRAYNTSTDTVLGMNPRPLPVWEQLGLEPGTTYREVLPPPRSEIHWASRRPRDCNNRLHVAPPPQTASIGACRDTPRRSGLVWTCVRNWAWPPAVVTEGFRGTPQSPGKCRGSVSFRHHRFLPNPFQFIIHPNIKGRIVSILIASLNDPQRTLQGQPKMGLQTNLLLGRSQMALEHSEQMNAWLWKKKTILIFIVNIYRISDPLLNLFL